MMIRARVHDNRESPLAAVSTGLDLSRQLQNHGMEELRPHSGHRLKTASGCPWPHALLVAVAAVIGVTWSSVLLRRMILRRPVQQCARSGICRRLRSAARPVRADTAVKCLWKEDIHPAKAGWPVCSPFARSWCSIPS